MLLGLTSSEDLFDRLSEKDAVVEVVWIDGGWLSGFSTSAFMGCGATEKAVEPTGYVCQLICCSDPPPSPHAGRPTGVIVIWG